MSKDEKLQAIRRRIDDIDQQLLSLISLRAQCAQDVAEVKKAAEGDVAFYRPEREAEVLRRIKEQNPGPLSNEEMARLFREIMSACLALEQPLKIAFLGPAGTFTQAAALKHFGHSVTTVPMASVGDVFRDVESGSCDFGVVPVENSTEGVVSHTLDTFVNSPLKICGEVELRIHHHLLGNGKPDKIQRIYSHQQSLAQCREWLNAHMNGIEQVAVSSNADAAQKVAREKNAAAIAGDMAAEIYGLKVLASNIEDEPDNTTRFLVIGRVLAQPNGNDKTSFLLSTRNRPGALYSLLEPFARHGISMSRIESRPSRRGVWDYVFFVDIDGHCQDAGVAAVLKELEEAAGIVKILGSYPRAVL